MNFVVALSQGFFSKFTQFTTFLIILAIVTLICNWAHFADRKTLNAHMCTNNFIQFFKKYLHNEIDLLLSWLIAKVIVCCLVLKREKNKRTLFLCCHTNFHSISFPFVLDIKVWIYHIAEYIFRSWMQIERHVLHEKVFQIINITMYEECLQTFLPP
jgi:hypothetical protein